MENKQPETAQPLSWAMFDIVSTLGEGAFGDVYKVKCLQSTCINEARPSERIVMSTAAVKKVKNDMITGGSIQAGMQGLFHPDKLKSLIKDQFYVIKVVDVAKVPQEAGLEALKEIETMQGLDSPYIVGYYDSFIEDQKINIILYYCLHGDLNSVIEKQKLTAKGFNENVIWKIFINICLGVYYLHSNNIIHRDIKSLNIFMAKESFSKIGDLGCAIKIENPADSKKQVLKRQQSKKGPMERIESIKSLQKMEDIEDNLFDSQVEGQMVRDDSMLLNSFINNSTDLSQSIQQLQEKVQDMQPKKKVENHRVGTPFYLAPELWRNELNTKGSDIWALGVILYELCCLQYPFPATEEAELQNKVLNQKMEKIKTGVSTELADFINKMLKKEQQDRLVIEEIIYSDVFQTKAVLQKVQLPLILNKSKILQKHKLNQIKDLNLTPLQKKLIGIKEKPSSEWGGSQSAYVSNPDSVKPHHLVTDRNQVINLAPKTVKRSHKTSMAESASADPSIELYSSEMVKPSGTSLLKEPASSKSPTKKPTSRIVKPSDAVPLTARGVDRTGSTLRQKSTHGSSFNDRIKARAQSKHQRQSSNLLDQVPKRQLSKFQNFQLQQQQMKEQEKKAAESRKFKSNNQKYLSNNLPSKGAPINQYSRRPATAMENVANQTTANPVLETKIILYEKKTAKIQNQSVSQTITTEEKKDNPASEFAFETLQKEMDIEQSHSPSTSFNRGGNEEKPAQSAVAKRAVSKLDEMKSKTQKLQLKMKSNQKLTGAPLFIKQPEETKAPPRTTLKSPAFSDSSGKKTKVSLGSTESLKLKGVTKTASKISVAANRTSNLKTGGIASSSGSLSSRGGTTTREKRTIETKKMTTIKSHRVIESAHKASTHLATDLRKDQQTPLKKLRQTPSMMLDQKATSSSLAKQKTKRELGKASKSISNKIADPKATAEHKTAEKSTAQGQNGFFKKILSKVTGTGVKSSQAPSSTSKIGLTKRKSVTSIGGGLSHSTHVGGSAGKEQSKEPDLSEAKKFQAFKQQFKSPATSQSFSSKIGKGASSEAKAIPFMVEAADSNLKGNAVEEKKEVVDDNSTPQRTKSFAAYRQNLESQRHKGQEAGGDLMDNDNSLVVPMTQIQENVEEDLISPALGVTNPQAQPPKVVCPFDSSPGADSLASPLVGGQDVTNSEVAQMNHDLLKDHINTEVLKLDKNSPVKFLEDSSSASKAGGSLQKASPMSDIVASLKADPNSKEKSPERKVAEDSISPSHFDDQNQALRGVNKFNPSKQKYKANPIGGDSDEDEGGFVLQKIDDQE